MLGGKPKLRIVVSMAVSITEAILFKIIPRYSNGFINNANVVMHNLDSIEFVIPKIKDIGINVHYNDFKTSKSIQSIMPSKLLMGGIETQLRLLNNRTVLIYDNVQLLYTEDTFMHRKFLKELDILVNTPFKTCYTLISGSNELRDLLFTNRRHCPSGLKSIDLNITKLPILMY